MVSVPNPDEKDTLRVIPKTLKMVPANTLSYARQQRVKVGGMPCLAGCLSGVRAESLPLLVALSSRSFGLTLTRLCRLCKKVFVI